MDVTDLEIKGRGIDFVWSRKYRSKIGPNTDLGNGWDFSYNNHIIPEGRGVRVCNGATRDDLYRPRPDGTFGFRGFFNSLKLETNGLYSLTESDKTVRLFYPTGEMASITDRNGNVIQFEVDCKIKCRKKWT
ncbi:MAG: hypothetical protein GKR87_00220 [Kiritimatiellae bacterium]|nr:hypothetical protein [Kiritimatiellia bacterium]